MDEPKVEAAPARRSPPNPKVTNPNLLEDGEMLVQVFMRSKHGLGMQPHLFSVPAGITSREVGAVGQFFTEAIKQLQGGMFSARGEAVPADTTPAAPSTIVGPNGMPARSGPRLVKP